MTKPSTVLVIVHPGSACGSADFNLGDDAPALRDALAQHVMAWRGDVLVVDNVLGEELRHYAMLDIALHSLDDRRDARLARILACDESFADWPDRVREEFDRHWPGGPHEVVVTGAWRHQDGSGCVNVVADGLSDHRTTVHHTALALP